MAPTLKELQALKLAAAPTPGQGLALDLNGRVPVSVLPREVTGFVSGAGAVTAGTGFTVSRTGAGRYSVTFTPAFNSAPIVVATAIAATGNEDLTISTIAGGVQVNANDAGIPVDRAFYFIAAEVR